MPLLEFALTQMVDLLNCCDGTQDPQSHGDILFMLGGNLGTCPRCQQTYSLPGISIYLGRIEAWSDQADFSWEARTSLVEFSPGKLSGCQQQG